MDVQTWTELANWYHTEETIESYVGEYEPAVKDRKIYLLAADRTGIERNTYLLGCSCIVKLDIDLKFIKNLDKTTNGVIVESLEFWYIT